MRFDISFRDDSFPLTCRMEFFGNCLTESIILQASVFAHDCLNFSRVPLSRMLQDTAFNTRLIGAPKRTHTSVMRRWLPENDPGLQAHRN
jgi:hypothetical protein